MKIQRCKGMRDLSPGEMDAFRAVETACRDSFTGWGYREVRTPTIEHLHLFTSAGTLTPGQLGKVYSFLDWDGWSGERVVLRPDGTIPVARLYTESLAGEPARLFYAANTFLFEDSGEKPRERWQCGVELIGAGTAAADAELVALSLETVGKLGLENVELRLSHAGLIRGLLEKLGLGPEERDRMLDRILDGDAGALAEVGRKSPELESALKPLVRMKGQSSGFLKNQAAVLPPELGELKPCLDDFLKTVSVLDELGIKYQINIASGAGFEYYTGLIFQLFVKGEKVGGGGRYDALIPAMGGGNVPAAGFALYMEKLMDMVKPEKSGPDTKPARICVRAGQPADIKTAFRAAAELRRAGYIAALDMERKDAGAGWVLEAGKSGFTLEDTVESRRVECRSMQEVLAQLEGQRGRQDSAA